MEKKKSVDASLAGVFAQLYSKAGKDLPPSSSSSSSSSRKSQSESSSREDKKRHDVDAERHSSSRHSFSRNYSERRDAEEKSSSASKHREEKHRSHKQRDSPSKKHVAKSPEWPVFGQSQPSSSSSASVVSAYSSSSSSSSSSAIPASAPKIDHGFRSLTLIDCDTTIALLGPERDQVQLMDIETQTIKKGPNSIASHDSAGSKMAITCMKSFGFAGHQLWLGTSGGAVLLLDTRSNQISKKWIPVHQSPCILDMLVIDDIHLWASCEDGTVRIFDINPRDQSIDPGAILTLSAATLPKLCLVDRQMPSSDSGSFSGDSPAPGSSSSSISSLHSSGSSMSRFSPNQEVWIASLDKRIAIVNVQEAHTRMGVQIGQYTTGSSRASSSFNTPPAGGASGRKSILGGASSNRSSFAAFDNPRGSSFSAAAGVRLAPPRPPTYIMTPYGNKGITTLLNVQEGRDVWAGADDGSVLVYNSSSRSSSKVFMRLHAGKILCMTNNDSYVIAGSIDQSISIFSSKEKTHLCSLDQLQAPPLSLLLYSNAHNSIFVGFNDRIRKYSFDELTPSSSASDSPSSDSLPPGPSSFPPPPVVSASKPTSQSQPHLQPQQQQESSISPPLAVAGYAPSTSPASSTLIMAAQHIQYDVSSMSSSFLFPKQKKKEERQKSTSLFLQLLEHVIGMEERNENNSVASPSPSVTSSSSVSPSASSLLQLNRHRSKKGSLRLKSSSNSSLAKLLKRTKADGNYSVEDEQLEAFIRAVVKTRSKDRNNSKNKDPHLASIFSSLKQKLASEVEPQAPSAAAVAAPSQQSTPEPTVEPSNGNQSGSDHSGGSISGRRSSLMQSPRPSLEQRLRRSSVVSSPIARLSKILKPTHFMLRRPSLEKEAAAVATPPPAAIVTIKIDSPSSFLPPSNLPILSPASASVSAVSCSPFPSSSITLQIPSIYRASSVTSPSPVVHRLGASPSTVQQHLVSKYSKFSFNKRSSLSPSSASMPSPLTAMTRGFSLSPLSPSLQLRSSSSPPSPIDERLLLPLSPYKVLCDEQKLTLPQQQQQEQQQQPSHLPIEREWTEGDIITVHLNSSSNVSIHWFKLTFVDKESDLPKNYELIQWIRVQGSDNRWMAEEEIVEWKDLKQVQLTGSQAGKVIKYVVIDNDHNQFAGEMDMTAVVWTSGSNPVNPLPPSASALRWTSSSSSNGNINDSTYNCASLIAPRVSIAYEYVGGVEGESLLHFQKSVSTLDMDTYKSEDYEGSDAKEERHEPEQPNKSLKPLVIIPEKSHGHQASSASSSASASPSFISNLVAPASSTSSIHPYSFMPSADHVLQSLCAHLTPVRSLDGVVGKQICSEWSSRIAIDPLQLQALRSMIQMRRCEFDHLSMIVDGGSQLLSIRMTINPVQLKLTVKGRIAPLLRVPLLSGSASAPIGAMIMIPAVHLSTTNDRQLLLMPNRIKITAESRRQRDVIALALRAFIALSNPSLMESIVQDSYYPFWMKKNAKKQQPFDLLLIKATDEVNANSRRQVSQAPSAAASACSIASNRRISASSSSRDPIKMDAESLQHSLTALKKEPRMMEMNVRALLAISGVILLD